MSKCLDPQNMSSYGEVIHQNTQYTTFILYTNLSVVKEEIAFFSCIKKKKEKVNEVKKSVYGQLCICILFHAFAPQVIIDFHFSINKRLKITRYITCTIINIQVYLIKTVFFSRNNTK